jgi:peptide maturation system acyl carrier-related protein
MPISKLSKSVETDFEQLFNKMFNLKKRFESDATLKDEYLMGKKIGLQPRELLCLFFAIEKKFNIKIPQEDIVNNRFDTYNKILDLVCELKNDSDN